MIAETIRWQELHLREEEKIKLDAEKRAAGG
jgi:hypothetical protein